MSTYVRNSVYISLNEDVAGRQRVTFIINVIIIMPRVY